MCWENVLPLWATIVNIMSKFLCIVFLVSEALSFFLPHPTPLQMHWTISKLLNQIHIGFFSFFFFYSKRYGFIFTMVTPSPSLSHFPFSLIVLYYSSHSIVENSPKTSSHNLLTGKNKNNSTPAGPAQKPGSFLGSGSLVGAASSLGAFWQVLILLLLQKP